MSDNSIDVQPGVTERLRATTELQKRVITLFLSMFFAFAWATFEISFMCGKALGE